MLHHGDLFAVLPTLAEASLDACVTDPPYGIGFMGKEWDSFSPAQAAKKQGLRQLDKSPAWRDGDRRIINPNLKGRTVNGAISSSQIDYDRSLKGQRAFQEWTERWAREVLRVLKPGAYVVVCGAPRSYHRMACGLEDAGFVVRDCFAWLFGQGFPKSLNLGDGKGTALKPAYEPIVLAWKPFKGSITANVATHGTGALNIDACRVSATLGDYDHPGDLTKGLMARNSYAAAERGDLKARQSEPNDLGRWPANVLLDEQAAAHLDDMTGDLTSGGTPEFRSADKFRNTFGEFKGGESEDGIGASIGGASRFYYVAKPSREERDYGCDALPAKSGGDCCDRTEGSAGLNNPRAGAGRTSGGRNTHPTVKPVELMRWLVKLITPINGTVLDPFMGSGTTGMACRYEQRAFVGIEREAAYVAIAERRIAAVTPLFADATEKPATRLQQEALPLLS